MTGEGSPRLWDVATLFLKLGVISFGGPAANVALMREEAVRRRNWVSDEQFLDLLGASNLIPGPTATELSAGVPAASAGGGPVLGPRHRAPSPRHKVLTVGGDGLLEIRGLLAGDQANASQGVEVLLGLGQVLHYQVGLADVLVRAAMPWIELERALIVLESELELSSVMTRRRGPAAALVRICRCITAVAEITM